MLRPFAFYRTPRLIFAAGAAGRIAASAAAYGSRVLLVTGGTSLERSGVFDAVTAAMTQASLAWRHVRVTAEPSPQLVDEAVGRFAGAIDCVVAIGGGSVLDAAKAVAAMLPLNEPVTPYLEGVGGRTHPGVTLPVIAVPTTAGTGSEATKNAVLSSVGPGGFKASLRHHNFVPACVVIDPELAVSCPAAVTAACGMDAITQLLESYVSTAASPMTDSLALPAFELATRALVPACTSGAADVSVRGDMAYAAFVSGVTLANAGLGAVHGLAGILGGRFPIPHGAACGTLLAPVTRLTIEKLTVSDPAASVGFVRKYAAAGRVVAQRPDLSDADGCRALVETLERWSGELGMPRLSDHGVTQTDLAGIAQKAESKTNPVKLDEGDMLRALEERL